MINKNKFKSSQKTPQKVWFHRKKKVNRWSYIIRDEYAIKAQKAWYRARSIYKLFEIQERFDLIKPNLSIIDIGCAPGSFLQAIASIVKEKLIIGVDLKEIKPLSYENVKTIVCDIFEQEKLILELEKIWWELEFDLITSDIAPNTTWRFDVDQFESVELNIAICRFSDKFLKKWWNMILKVFKGEDFFSIVNQVKKRFNSMKTYKPRACRDSSHEEYVICLDKK